MSNMPLTGPPCVINGKLDFNGNFPIILDADWLWCLVAMVVTIESKVTIHGKFYAKGQRGITIAGHGGTCCSPLFILKALP